jgi:hypothetical protein
VRLLDGHTQIWHDATDSADARPGWVTSGGSWPPAARAGKLYLGQNAALTAGPPASEEPADDYVSPTVSAGTENGIAFGQSGQLWKTPGTPAGAQAYTTPKLGHDVELLGPASVNLWLKSTGTDAGLQATITEVRPDGQETYVNRGWLTASHRKLDQAASTATMPVQTHREADAEPLEPGQPTPVRIEVFPFEHVFRAGSRIRLIIDTPSQTGGWNFQPVPNGGVNTILHDAAHPSEVVLSTMPRSSVEKGYPACDTVLNQPCRPDAFTDSAPAGELQWPGGATPTPAPGSGSGSGSVLAGAVPTAASRPAARSRGRCTRRKPVTVRLPKARKQDKLVSAKLAINGRTVSTLRARKLTRVVTLRKVPTTAFRLTVTARTRNGRTLRSTRRYGPC